MKKTILLIILTAFISGCQTIQNLADSISKPSLSITDVHVTDFTFDEIELTYDVKIDNPNAVAVQMLGYDYDFNINDNDFLNGDQQKKLRIESSGASTFQLPMRLNFNELYNLFSGLRGRDEADYNLAANLNFDLPVLGETSLPLKKSGSLPLLKLPKINVSSLKVKDVNFTEAKLSLNLNVDNPNGFGLLVKALNYDLNVNGQNWIKGNSSKSLTIDKNKKGSLSIPISVNIAKIGTSVVSLLNNSGDINFKLNGDFDFGATHPLLEDLSTRFSFDEAGDVPLIR